MRLSIIIPTLNEAHFLPSAIAAARAGAERVDPEIIVSDCGSADGTAAIAQGLGARCVTADPPAGSRAAALNHGVRFASGNVLLFLDADTLVPAGYDRAIEQTLTDPHTVGGAFEFQLDSAGLGLRLVELINRVRYRIWPWYYGDQGIFVRLEAYHRLGGYTDRRLLEAAELCQRLGKLGRLVLVRKYMTTSARRFVEGGVYRVLARDIWIWWLDLLGRDPERFAAAYQQDNRQRACLASS